MDNPKIFQFGLIGWPLGHSFSPILHSAALIASGYSGEYRLFPIEPLPNGEAQLRKILQQVRIKKLHGINVTIPHKQNVIPLLDQLTSSAQEIGAVNTIYLKDGQLIGDNTDTGGFLKDLKIKIPQTFRKKIALVLGAGGSSRAITYSISRAGWQVIVAARRIEQAQKLANDLSDDHKFNINACSLSPEGLKEITPSLIVNATPVGMSPNISNTPWPNNLPFPDDCFLYDLIYNPESTLLVQQARNSGLNATGGLGMLVEQAALSFEIWTGTNADRSAMFTAIKHQTKNAEYNQEELHDA